MNTSYELTVDDLVALSQFHTAQSPTVRRQRAKCLVLMLIAMLFLPGLILLTTDKPLLEMAFNIWPLILGPLLFALFIPRYFKWSTGKLSKKMFNEGQNSGFYGDCSISLDDTEIRESKSFGETARNWSAVQRIVVSNDHIFVYTSGFEAFVVPKRAFSSDDEFDTFLQSIIDRSGVTVERV